MSCKTDCYWYHEDQDMNAMIPECKARKLYPLDERDCEKCNKYHSKWKKTNADRVRSMTDRELEQWFWWMHREMMNYTDSVLFVHDWLKKEAEE